MILQGSLIGTRTIIWFFRIASLTPQQSLLHWHWGNHCYNGTGAIIWFFRVASLALGQSYDFSGLLHWHWGNHMIAPVPVKQPWRIQVNKTHKATQNCINNKILSWTNPWHICILYMIITQPISIIWFTLFTHFMCQAYGDCGTCVHALQTRYRFHGVVQFADASAIQPWNTECWWNMEHFHKNNQSRQPITMTWEQNMGIFCEFMRGKYFLFCEFKLWYILYFLHC